MFVQLKEEGDEEGMKDLPSCVHNMGNTLRKMEKLEEALGKSADDVTRPPMLLSHCVDIFRDKNNMGGPVGIFYSPISRWAGFMLGIMPGLVCAQLQ